MSANWRLIISFWQITVKCYMQGKRVYLFIIQYFREVPFVIIKFLKGCQICYCVLKNRQ